MKEYLQLLAVLITLSMIATTMAGNAMVCLAVLIVRKLKQPPNFLLVPNQALYVVCMFSKRRDEEGTLSYYVGEAMVGQ